MLNTTTPLLPQPTRHPRPDGHLPRTRPQPPTPHTAVGTRGDHWIPVGLHAGLDEAMREAVREALRFSGSRLGLPRHIA
ncbi:MAG: hypothetical protein F4131_01935 [Acidimicrobiaceae bacterium]|nr:hypothetical protein [Acidimicrobiaceae bacterium]